MREHKYASAMRTFQDCPTSFCDFGRDVAGDSRSDGDIFDAVMNLKSPAGRSRVLLELEVKSIGENLDGLGTWKCVPLDNALEGRTPLFGRSRWISLPENAPREMDIRVLPEPGVVVALMIGAGALAGFARRGRSRSRD